MRGWCVRAERWLEARGVTMCLGENLLSIQKFGGKLRVVTDKTGIIDADHVIWTNDNAQALATLLGFDFDTRSYQSGTPMLFATMVTRRENIKDFTYLQNFNQDGITYRTASAGIYSNQTDAAGNSFVTSECPAPIGSERWNNFADIHGAIWQECKDLGIVSLDAKLSSHSVLRLPSTFKVAKLGYDEKIAEFQRELTVRAPKLVFRDPKPFFRRDIYLDSFKLQALLEA